MAVLVVDADHFKQINDSYSHQVGDRVLQALAALFTKELRNSDFCARYGGEEFVIVLPETGSEVAEYLGQRLCKSVSDMQVCDDDGDRVPVTVSIGIAVYPEHAGSAESLVRAADDAMYQAKRAGRNRVCMARSLLESASN